MNDCALKHSSNKNKDLKRPPKQTQQALTTPLLLKKPCLDNQHQDAALMLYYNHFENNVGMASTSTWCMSNEQQILCDDVAGCVDAMVVEISLFIPCNHQQTQNCTQVAEEFNGTR
jgi:hypothetical protein